MTRPQRIVAPLPSCSTLTPWGSSEHGEDPLARAESVEITKPSFSFTTKRGYYFAQLGYSYSVAGTAYSGRYRREFPTEHEAEEFVRDLKGKPVAVHCDSTNPSSSALLEPDVEGLLQHRAPARSESFAQENSVPLWIRPFLWFFICFSAIGLVVSVWVHLGAVMGRRVAPEAFFWMLHSVSLSFGFRQSSLPSGLWGISTGRICGKSS